MPFIVSLSAVSKLLLQFTRVLKKIRIEFGSPKLEKIQKNRFQKFENPKIYHNLFSMNCLFSKKIAKYLVFSFKFKQNLRKAMSKYF